MDIYLEKLRIHLPKYIFNILNILYSIILYVLLSSQFNQCLQIRALNKLDGDAVWKLLNILIKCICVKNTFLLYKPMQRESEKRGFVFESVSHVCENKNEDNFITVDLPPSAP